MEEPAPPIPMEKLVAHREWVRRVARALVRDESLADDLEQEVWLEALRKPPRSGRSFGGWLAAAMRHNLQDRKRSESRRRIRETAVARPEGGKSAADLVAEAEVLKRVVAAVLGIEEPYRGTLLLRYFEDLSPREISLRQGIPVETVRTRIKRGLERLRGTLGGDRGGEGLALAVAPLLVPEHLLPEASGIAAGTGGGFAMGVAAKVGLAACMAGIALGGVVVWRTSRSEPGIVPRSPTPTAVAAAPAPRPGDLPLPPATEPSPPPDLPEAGGMEVEPAGPSMDERLGERPAELVYESANVGNVIEDLARRLGLDPQYESDLVHQYCFASNFSPVKFRTIPIRDVLDMAVANVRSPVDGKRVAWEVRKDRLFVLLMDPPPPPMETPEAAKERSERETALLDRLRSERTSFGFEIETLMDGFRFLTDIHRIAIEPDREIQERVNTLTIRLSLDDVTLREALDELLRVDPDLLWEVRGPKIIVRRRQP